MSLAPQGEPSIKRPMVPSTSDRHLIKLENQVQLLMEAHISPKSPVQMNKIASSCEICSGPHDTRYCMENSKQAFVDYTSLHTNEAGGEQNMNLSSTECVYFINTTTILSREDEPRKTGSVKPDTKENDHDTIVKVEEEGEESEEEGKEEKDDP
nr:MAK10-like protein [Tanacetum cinerariifolium]